MVKSSLSIERAFLEGETRGVNWEWQLPYLGSRNRNVHIHEQYLVSTEGMVTGLKDSSPVEIP